MENKPQSVTLPRWAHFSEGGTGVTNITCDIPRRVEVYTQAAANLGLDGITVVNRAMDGGDWCWSLHDCGNKNDLNDFWEEVCRLDPPPDLATTISDMLSIATKAFSIPQGMLEEIDGPCSALEAKQAQHVADEILKRQRRRIEQTVLANILPSLGKLNRRARKQDQAWRNMNRPGLSQRRRSYWYGEWIRSTKL